MSLPFTSVVSYHQNPLTCGVAKFSAELAKRLGVPFGPLYGAWGTHPLFSLKWSEIPAADDIRLYVWDKLRGREREGLPHSVFWHDAGDDRVTRGATHVFYADPSLGSPGLWCPSLITPRPRPVRLFSFGMAGRLQPEKYRRVKELLDDASIRYHLRVSVGIHEGTSLDGAEKHFDALKAIMGPENVTILGILSDDAVSEELANADYVLAFFKDGVRLNNTTVHAAIEAGRRVITNGDAYLAHVVTNIDGLRRWPEPRHHHIYSWDALIEAMRKECEKLTLPTAR